MAIFDENCLEAVRAHLREHFPNCALNDQWDGDNGAHLFQVKTTNSELYLLRVSGKVLATYQPLDLAIFLSILRAGPALTTAPERRLLLKLGGLQPF
jgi:hypothetical protein